MQRNPGRLFAFACVLVIGLTAGSATVQASPITFSPSGTLFFASTYYGDPGTYVNVSGSATVGGSFVLNENIGGLDPELHVDAFLIIGPQSIGNASSTSWVFSLSGLGIGDTNPVSSASLSTSAPAFLPDETAIVPVLVTLTTYYEAGYWEWVAPDFKRFVVLESDNVAVTSRTVTVQAVPEPGTLVLVATGVLWVVRRRHRSADSFS